MHDYTEVIKRNKLPVFTTSQMLNPPVWHNR